MDGFYVCKIQKLSDKIKTENEDAQGGKEKLDKDTDFETIPKNEASKQKEKSADKRKPGKKKRSSMQDQSPRTKKPKTEKVSIPPPTNNKKQGKNKKNSAKMTKPRRMRPEKVV